MLEQQPSIQLSPSSQSMVPRSALQQVQADKALTEFLGKIKRMQTEKRKAYFGPGKEYDLPIPVAIAQPQVFFSYAWGKEGDSRFAHLQTFLSGMSHYLRKAGVHVWFDLERMVGDVESQMRDGVTRSDVVLLFGTDIYAQKTGIDSKTNVKKELDFTLEKAAKDKHCLMPLLLEGSFQTTFPSLGFKYIMVDTTPWIDLENGQHGMQAYIKALTSLTNPVGILPAILGLQRMDDGYQTYRESCRRDYQIHVSALTAQLQEIYAPASAQQGAYAQPTDEKHTSPEDTTAIKNWLEDLEKSIRSSEESQKALQKAEMDLLRQESWQAYEKMQTEKVQNELLAPKSTYKNAYKIVLQKLEEGRQAFVTRRPKVSAFTAQVEAKLKEDLLEKEAQINQLENQRIILESTRAQLTTELETHKSTADTLAQDITRQQMQQLSLIKESLDLAERQTAKLDKLLQQLFESKEIKGDFSECQELISDIRSKTQELKELSEESSPNFKYGKGLIIDLGKLYQRCYIAIIHLTREAGSVCNTAKAEQAQTDQEMKACKEQCETSSSTLIKMQQDYKDTKSLLAEKEKQLVLLADREQTLSTALAQKQAALELALQKQAELEKDKLQAPKLTVQQDERIKVNAAAVHGQINEEAEQAKSTSLAQTNQQYIPGPGLFQEPKMLAPPPDEKEIIVGISEIDKQEFFRHIARGEQDYAQVSP